MTRPSGPSATQAADTATAPPAAPPGAPVASAADTARRAAALGVVLAATLLLALAPRLLHPLLPELIASDAALDLRVRHQLLTLPLALLVLLAVRAWVPAGVRFFRIGRLDAPVTPVRAIGLTPGPTESWRQVGRNFAVVVTAVTAIVVGLQLLPGADVDVARAARMLPWIVLLAASNAFVEETITRFGVVATLIDRVGPNAAYLASGAVFGIAHYVGVPGGPVGVLVAGFLGWLLAKSVGETGGLGWAWFLHALQDVVIFTAIFAAGVA